MHLTSTLLHSRLHLTSLLLPTPILLQHSRILNHSSFITSIFANMIFLSYLFIFILLLFSSSFHHMKCVILLINVNFMYVFICAFFILMEIVGRNFCINFIFIRSLFKKICYVLSREQSSKFSFQLRYPAASKRRFWLFWSHEELLLSSSKIK